jgi:hypothetical protein
MSEQIEKSESAKKQEDWMNTKWRPMMGWMYMVVCFCDFVIFPVLWSALHAVLHSTNMTQWQPLTLNGAGLFHIAMGAVLGIAAMGRTQEKLAGANNGGATTPSSTPSFMPSFGSSTPPPTPSFSNVPLGGNSMSTVPAAFTPAPAPAFGAVKPKGPAPAEQPEL